MNNTKKINLFYRQKILLALLQSFGGSVGRTDLQKYLFLFTEQYPENKVYEFVPYNYGCFSFQSYADRRKLIDLGILDTTKEWKISTNDNFLAMLDMDVRQKISDFAKKYEKIRGNNLIRKVYREYPYYAIRSRLAQNLMSDKELNKIKEQEPSTFRKTLFTIGYEGNTIDNYLNRLIINGVKLLVDVRKNPLSRKYGFSKTILSNNLDRIGIKYHHMPELGIISDKRKSLETARDYQLLFKEYERTVLKDKKESLKSLINLVEENKRVALTCFEADPCMCHRGRVAESIERMPAWKYKIKHI